MLLINTKFLLLGQVALNRRQISRNKAKQTFSKNQLEKILEKDGVELIGGATDESPLAYKDIHQVMDAQKELVNVLAAFYPKIVRME